MEHSIDIRLRLHFEPRTLRPVLAGLFVFLLAADLASESVTLTTYYPAPSGVYTQMITTNNTFLARDAGNVGIGTAAPVSKLDVTGTAYVSKLVMKGNNTANTADPLAADFVIGSNSLGAVRHDSSIMFWSNASASRIFNQNDSFFLSAWNQNPTAAANVVLGAGPGFSSHFGGNLGVAGTPPGASPYLYVNAANAPGCAVTFGNCAPGQYITWVPGIYVDNAWWYTGDTLNFVPHGGISGFDVTTAPTPHYCCNQ